MNFYGGQKSRHSYNRPIFTTMNTYPQDYVINAEDADDVTVVNKCWSKDESNIFNGLVKPILASRNTSASTDNVGQLIMKSMTSFCQLRCGCYKGTHNQMDAGLVELNSNHHMLQRQSNSKNLKHGVKPKRPPLEKPPTPRQATFG